MTMMSPKIETLSGSLCERRAVNSRMCERVHEQQSICGGHEQQSKCVREGGYEQQRICERGRPCAAVYMKEREIMSSSLCVREGDHGLQQSLCEKKAD